MESLSSQTCPDLKDWRRLRAYELAPQGWKQNRIVQALCVTEGAVSQWLSRSRACAQSLRRRKPPSSSDSAGTSVAAVGAQVVVKDRFGVGYHVSHIVWLLRSLGYLRQRPEVKATQRDEAAIAAWKQTEWHGLKRGH